MDMDIDKANVLGLKFINGQLVVWSPYYDLSTRENAELSENLPFPTGKKLQIGLSHKMAFEVMDKTYEVGIDNDTQKVIRDGYGHAVILQQDSNGVWNWTNQEDIVTPEQYQILMVALSKLSEGSQINFPDAPGLGIINGIKDFTNIDLASNLGIFLQTLDTNTLQGKIKLIEVFNELGFIPEELSSFAKIVDKHNTYLKKSFKRPALYNYISILTKNISKDPINLIQGQVGIDEATGPYKELVSPNGKFNRLSANPKNYDPSTVYARIKSLCLTLSGRQNVGICASAMKTFEAMSYYYYEILANGTEEEQNDLLFNIKIDGQNLNMIANAYAANTDTIKIDAVKEALTNVNNLEDAFIAFSVFVSLSTDNAKDPTLAKYNAGPEMIGCYTAGIVLGLNINDMANLIVSDTGILLSQMQKGNAFTGKQSKFSRLGQAISYLMTPPRLSFSKFKDDVNTLNSLNNLLKKFGIRTNEKGKYDASTVERALKDGYTRRKMRALAMSILSKSSTERDNLQLLRSFIKDIENDYNYWSWIKGNRQKYKTLFGNDSRTEEEEKAFKKLVKAKQEFENLQNKLNKFEDILDSYNQADDSVKESILNNVEEIKEIKALESETDVKILGKNEYLRTWAKDVLDWSDKYDIVESDRKDKKDQKTSRLYDIKKLNDFNEEMGELRKVLALNQGLPNSVQDQIAWVRGFRSILTNAVKRKNLSMETPELAELAKLNGALRKSGRIYFEEELGIDLNSFLNNKTYQDVVIKAYSVAKQGVNIMKAMLVNSHYKGFLNIMNLLFEGGKSISVVYKEQSKIFDRILPKLKLGKDKLPQFQKAVAPIIFRKLNNEFLQQEQTYYSIPKFKIVDGKLIESEDEDGNLIHETIKLGTESGNQKFKNWVETYLYPELKRTMPDNAFVQGISLRTYNFNIDHNVSRNLSKRQQFNMKDAKENAQFNEMKQGLAELNHDGILTALFYYNLIAYNGQPGAQSLTDLFEDQVIQGSNEHISNYSKFLCRQDQSNREIFNLNTDEDMLLQLLAPTVTQYDDTSKYPYMYIVNPENNNYVLVKPKEETVVREMSPEEEEIYAEQQAIAAEYDMSDENERLDMEIEGTRRIYNTFANVKQNKKVQEVSSNYSNLYKQQSYVLGQSELINVDEINGILENQEEILDSDYSKINLNISGTQTTLQEVFDRAKQLGWSEDEYKQILKVKQVRTGNGITYKQLDLDILKYGLNTITKQKPNQEDCG